MGNYPMSQGGSASQQANFVGLEVHLHHQISGEQSTSLEDGIPLNPSHSSASANPPTTGPTTTYYDDQATRKDRGTGDYYTTPGLDLPYTPQAKQQYYSRPTEPFTTDYSEASPSLLGPIAPPRIQFHNSYAHPLPPSGAVRSPQAQLHNSYKPSQSNRGQERQSRYQKGRKGWPFVDRRTSHLVVSRDGKSPSN